MIPKYGYPGVHIEEVPSGVKTIEGASTSTTAFIGLAAQGDLDKAVLVTSFNNYEGKYGSFYIDPDGNILSYLAYSVQHFFNNGGKKCYIVRVAPRAQIPDFRVGFKLLDVVRDIGIITVPGVGSREITDFGSTYCEKRSKLTGINDCFFIGEMKAEDVTVQKAQLFIDSLISKSPYTAVYFPWLTMVDPTGISQKPIPVPPSGFVAGVYARIDGKRGVWKAPVGTEANVSGATGLLKDITDAEQDLLNEEGINCIRSFPATGLVIWGARTLATRIQPEWKYISVRRLAIYIETSIHKGTQWAVFEPNNEPLWSSLRLNIGSFMMRLFRQGAFRGDTPSEAYFVKCDGETTTQADVNLGIVNILVGFAPLKPAEFMIIKIQQMAKQIQP